MSAFYTFLLSLYNCLLKFISLIILLGEVQKFLGEVLKICEIRPVDIYYTGTFLQIYNFPCQTQKNPTHGKLYKSQWIFLVFSHLCNHTLLGNTFYMHVNISKSPLIVGEWVKLESV